MQLLPVTEYSATSWPVNGPPTLSMPENITNVAGATPSKLKLAVTNVPDNDPLLVCFVLANAIGFNASRAATTPAIAAVFEHFLLIPTIILPSSRLCGANAQSFRKPAISMTCQNFAMYSHNAP